jgi:hypothetical protein
VIPARDRAELLGQTLDSVLVRTEASESRRSRWPTTRCDRWVQRLVASAAIGSPCTVSRHRSAWSRTGTPAWSAPGTLVHLLHDDDLVLPATGRSPRRAACRKQRVLRRFHTVDEGGARTDLSPLLQLRAGVLQDAVGLLGSRQQIQAPAIAVRRVVYEQLGGFRPDLAYSPDWEMWVRIACHFPVWYEPEPLACYRMHGGADTTRAARLGGDAAGSRQAIAVFSEYLPPEHRRRLPRRARENVGRYAAFLASRFISQRDLAAAGRQLFQAMRTSRSPRIAADLARYFVAGVRGNLRRLLGAAGVLRPTGGAARGRR